MLSRTEALAPPPAPALPHPSCSPGFRGPIATRQPIRRGAGPSGFFVSGDAPLVRVGVTETIVILHEPVHLAAVGHAILAPRKVTDRE